MLNIKNIKDQFSLNHTFLENLKENKESIFNPEKIFTKNILKNEEIKVLENLIKNATFPNFTCEKKEKFLKFIQIYKKWNEPAGSDDSWLAWSLKNAISVTLKSDTLLSWGVWGADKLYGLNLDKKSKEIVNAFVNMHNHLKAYFDESFYDLKNNFNEKSLENLENFFDTNLFIFSKDQESNPENAINFLSLIPDLDGKKKENLNSLQFDQILKNIFDFSETKALSKIFDDFENEIDTLNELKDFNFIKIFFDNALDLVKDTSSFLDGKKKIANLLSICGFDLEKEENKAFAEIFNSFFDLFKSRKEGENEFLIIKSSKKLNEFTEKILNLQIEDSNKKGQKKDLFEKDLKKIFSISNKMLEIMFVSNQENIDEEIKINFQDKSIKTLAGIIKNIPNILEENLNQNSAQNLLRENKEFIKIALNLAKNLRKTNDVKSDLKKDAIQKKIILLFKNFDQKTLVELIKDIVSTEDIKNDLIDLLVFLNKKIIDGLIPKETKVIKQKKKIEERLETEELEKLEEKKVVSSKELFNVVIEGIFHGNNPYKKESLKTIQNFLDFLDEEDKQTLLPLLQSFGETTNDESIVINAKMVHEKTKTYLTFLRDKKETSEKKKVLYDFAIQCLDLLCIFGDDTKLKISNEQRNAFFEQIYELLRTDLIDGNIEMLISSSRSQKLPIGLEEAQVQIQNLRKERTDLCDKLESLQKINESHKYIIATLSEEKENLQKRNKLEITALENCSKINLGKKDSSQYLYFSIISYLSGIICLMTSATLKENALIGKNGFQVMLGVFAACLVLGTFCLVKSYEIKRSVKEQIAKENYHPSDNVNLGSVNPVNNHGKEK